VTLGRFAWRLQFAALALPAVVGVAMSVAPSLTPMESASTDSAIAAFAAQTFAYILLGSLALNAWLRVRRTPGGRVLPRFDATVQLVLVVVTLLWAVSAFVETVTGADVLQLLTPVLAVVVAAASVASFPFAERESWKHGRRSRETISVAWPIGVLVASAVTVVALVVHLALDASATTYRQYAPLDSAVAWAELTVGLPWSIPLTPVALFAAGATEFVTLVMAPAVLTNALISIVLIASPRARDAFTRRVLTRKHRGDVDALAEDMQ